MMGGLARNRTSPGSTNAQSLLSRIVIEEASNLTSSRKFNDLHGSVIVMLVVVLVGGQRPINELLNSLVILVAHVPNCD
jgi:hypothetical protein